MTVRIVTDSTSDIAPADAARYGLTVVPLNVHFGTEQLRDGIDIGPEEFQRRLVSSPVLPKTSQPSAGAFLEVYRGLAAETDSILSVHISGKLSGTVNSARAARDALGGRARVEIVDSGTVSWPLGYAARLAAQAAATGKSLDECTAVARDTLARNHLLVVLDTLEYLQKGGRIGRARAWFGGILNIKPILTFKEGEVAPVERVRSRAKADERVVELAAKLAPAEWAVVCHTGIPVDAERRAERLRKELPGATVETGWIGPVVGVYAGPKALGVAVVTRTPDPDGEQPDNDSG
jgi:DegV family protein with EDD domain